MSHLILFHGPESLGAETDVGGPFFWQDEGYETEGPFSWHCTGGCCIGGHLEVGMVQDS